MKSLKFLDKRITKKKWNENIEFISSIIQDKNRKLFIYMNVINEKIIIKQVVLG